MMRFHVDSHCDRQPRKLGKCLQLIRSVSRRQRQGQLASGGQARLHQRTKRTTRNHRRGTRNRKLSVHVQRKGKEQRRGSATASQATIRDPKRRPMTILFQSMVRWCGAITLVRMFCPILTIDFSGFPSLLGSSHLGFPATMQRTRTIYSKFLATLLISFSGFITPR